MRVPIIAVSLVVLTSALLAFTPDEAVAGGSVEGTVYVRNYMGDYRAAGWVTVTATNGISTATARTPSDGRYRFLGLATGTWEITVNLQGYKTVTQPIAVPDGSTVTYDFHLEQSGVPIPEFQEYATPFITSISLLLVVVLMRRRTIFSPRLR